MQLSIKENKPIIISLIAMSTVWVYGYIVKPQLIQAQNLEQILPKKQVELQQVRARTARYLALNQHFDNSQPNQANGKELMPFLDQSIQAHGLINHVGTFEEQTRDLDGDYTERLITISFQDVVFSQLVHWLSDIQPGHHAPKCESLHITQSSSHPENINPTIVLRQVAKKDN